MNINIVIFTIKKLERLCINFLGHANVPIKIAKQISEYLIISEMSNQPSHGLIRLIQYFKSVKDKSINISAKPKLRTNRNLTIIDCDRAFGQISMKLAIDVIKKRKKDISIIAVNNCSHVGRLSDYLEKLCNLNYITLIFCNGGLPSSALYPSIERICSTNPLGIGIPIKKKENVIIDFSSTMYPEGTVRLHAQKKIKLKRKSIYDKEGKTTNDPMKFYQGGSLMPIGGIKGSGLMLAAELIGGYLTSDNNPLNKNYLDGNNCLIISINKKIFNFNRNNFNKQFNQLSTKMKYSKKIQKISNTMPYLIKTNSSQKRINIDKKTIDQIIKFSKKENFILKF